ncbi:hypothetical protein OG897_32215 [Streptomyces sp. NBC_00237]|uniref:hypothetical protein n=1 Tax=Streptomyces sp. NBC_00237 TaxID=2975687 RepID=UPI00224D762A|nr:hypothetical protein [Streptomyces sp. NBC_00237]MCX5206068.1 hypothetical protein [Streptomyces sp. NBC_00237]
MSDADRLETAFAQLIATDNKDGGSVGLETRALAFAHHADELQTVGSASQRVRARLYYLGAAFTGTALWAAIDARELERAQRHLERATHLAALSGNAEIQLRLWAHAALLAAQQERYNDAIAAANVSRTSTACRRDPLLRSFATARLAGIQAGRATSQSDRAGALRVLDHATDAFHRADSAQPRPAWIAFYDRAELDGLSALVMGRIGAHERAEAFLHSTLSRLRPDLVRNRVYYGAQLALAQLRQGDPEEGCATAASVLPSLRSDSLTGRTGELLATFHSELLSLAPGKHICGQWTDMYTSKRRLT